MDVVVLDARALGPSAFEATRALCADEDVAGVRVAMLVRSRDEDALPAIAAGASAVLDSTAPVRDIVGAVRVVAAGSALWDARDLLRILRREVGLNRDEGPPAAGRSGLTAHEAEVVDLVASGLDDDAIAERLVVATSTVRVWRERAMMQLDARDRAQLALRALRSGLPPPTVATRDEDRPHGAPSP